MTAFKLQSLTPNLMVADVNKSITFYQQLLGFELVQSVPESGDFDWAMITRDDVTLMLHKRESMQEEYEQFKNMTTGASVIHYVCVENIEALYNAISDPSIICKKLTTTFYGKREFAIQDSDGYVFTFSEDE